MQNKSKTALAMLVAAPWHDGGGSNAGRVYLRSGPNGGSLGVLDGAAAGDLYGHGLASIGDVDGDDAAEMVLAAPGDDTGGSSAGSVTVRYSSPCDVGP